MFQHTCPNCNSTFETDRRSSICCSTTCAGIYRSSPNHISTSPAIESNKRWKRNNKERVRNLEKTWIEDNLAHHRETRKKNIANKYSDPVWREKELKNRRKFALKIRIDTMMAYGGLICSCDHNGIPCGPHPIEYLALDHINGNGKTRGESSTALYRRLRREKYPSGFRVLCHNCNCSLGYYGRCPMSKTEKQDRKSGKPRSR